MGYHKILCNTTYYIERIFQRECSPYLAWNDRSAFSLQNSQKNTMHGLVEMYVMRWLFCWTTFLYNLALSCIDKWQGFPWALIVLPWLLIYSCFVMKGTLWCLFLAISRLILLMPVILFGRFWRRISASFPIQKRAVFPNFRQYFPNS